MLKTLILLCTLFLTLCATPLMSFAAPPQRIVSLSPGVTEILFALGLGAKVVGDTTYCDYPPAAKTKPHVGDVITNYEAVVGLRPDLVIADGLANRSAIPRLQALHLPLLIVEANSLSDVEKNIARIGTATGAEKQAGAVIAVMRRKERKAAEIAAGLHGHPLKTLVIVGTNPLYVAGTGSFMGQLIQRAGGFNVAQGVGFAPWSKEAAIASQPQVVFCDADERAGLVQDAAWRSTPAMRSGNMFSFDSAAAIRPGPRLADALIEVAQDLARARR